MPSLVTTVAADVRVRTWPGLASPSERREPLLPQGTDLVVLAGPVAVDGYHWYEVVPLGSTGLPYGWAAAASRTEERWLGPGEADCPPLPTTFAALASLPLGLGPLCFSGQRITIEVRLVAGPAEAYGPWYTPAMFDGHDLRASLVDPSQTEWHPAASLGLHVDPAAKLPATLPLGKVVTITGMFDHPAADACIVSAFGDMPSGPTGWCRLSFVVTDLVP